MTVMAKELKPKRHGLPMNIQFFAESPADDKDPEGKGTGADPVDDDDNTPSIEELMADLAKERAEKAKLKNSFDSTSSEVANLKKQLRAKQTAEEQEEEAKREEEETRKAYVKRLEDEVNLSKKTKNYMILGMSEELALETAKADLEGDEEAVNSNIRKNQELKIKEAEQEWLKSRPDPQSGNGEGDEEKDAFVSGFRNGFQGMLKK